MPFRTKKQELDMSFVVKPEQSNLPIDQYDGALYKISDETQIRHRIHVNQGILAALMVPFIAAVIIALVFRIDILAYFAAIAGVVVFIFFDGMQIGTLRSYLKYFREIRNGMKHEKKGVLRSIKDVVLQKGVLKYPVIITDEEGSEDTVYLDVERNLQGFEPGDQMDLILCGMDIVAASKA